MAIRIEEKKKSPQLICGYERQGRDQGDILRLSYGYRKLREKATRVKRQTTFELWNGSDTM